MKHLASLTALVVAALAMALTTAPGTLAAEKPSLKVGDPAPRLQTGKWAQGDPVKKLEKGTTYIVEFWATWCGPCRATIPHVNELQQTFKDRKLIVIGQDVFERDESKVEPFIKQMGGKMTYRVAYDDKSQNPRGAMATTWMEAAGQNGIPSAFVVDKEGTIVWIGHPAALQPKMLEMILDGTFDLQKAAAETEAAERNQQLLAQASQRFGKAKLEGKWDDAEAALKELEPLVPAEHRAGLSMVRAEIAFGRGNYEAGYRLVDTFANTAKDNPQLQNQLAWYISSDKKLKQRDLVLAEKFARRAVEATDKKNPAILDTLARIQFMAEQKAAAIETQGAAVKLAEGEARTALQKTLDSYQAGKLPAAE